MRYIIALDEGTTSAKAVIYDAEGGRIIASAGRGFSLTYPRSGWVETDAVQLWGAQYGALSEVLAESDVDLRDVYGIGVANQRETVVVWDRATGAPLHNAIIWQCRRTADFCAKLREDEAMARKIREKTGLTIDPYFSASKMRWLLENVDGLRERAERGEVCLGTVDSYIIFRLTGGSFVTDVSNASRTMLMNTGTCDWDDELLELFGIPRVALAEIIGSDENAGHTISLKRDVPVTGIAGDQQAALFGQCCFSAGEAKNTYGTGCFILMNTGSRQVRSEKLLSTVAWKVGGKVTYALEGSVFNGGSSVQWLRDNLKFMESSCDSERIATSAVCCDGRAGTDGVYLVPAFTGMGAPYWESDARGIICGITRSTNISHIVRAALESMAYSARDVIGRMEEDSGVKISVLKADGGASSNGFLMQFQSDVLGVKIVRPVSGESTAMGAVYLCGLGTGAFSSEEDILSRYRTDAVFERKISSEEADILYEGWKKAVSRALL